MKKIILSLILMGVWSVSAFSKTLTLSDFDDFSRSVYVYDKNLYDDVTNFISTNFNKEPSRFVMVVDGDKYYIDYVRNTVYNYCDKYLDDWYFVNYDAESEYASITSNNLRVMVLDRRGERKVKTESSKSDDCVYISPNQSYYDKLNKQVYADLNKLRKINPDVIAYEILTSSFDHYENIYYVSIGWASKFGYSIVIPSDDGDDKFKDYKTIYNYENGKTRYYLLFCRKDIIVRPQGRFYALEE